MRRFICVLVLHLVVRLGFGQTTGMTWDELAPPEVGKLWILPAQGKPANPIWGHTNGMRVGLAPMPGPRGLLRIYSPYLGLEDTRMINFIAVEPIPFGMDKREFSELEMSTLDNRRGKRFWSSNDSLSFLPGKEEFPARGVITIENGVEALSVFVFVEPFTNGAKVYLRLKFYSDRPYEVEISTYAREDSEKLANCIVTATMGNLARLRTLYLADSKRSAAEIWPYYSGDAFTSHASFQFKEMIRDNKGNCYFISAPDDKDPQNVEYSSGTNDHWKYKGKYATQYWYSKKPDQSLRGLVNGRVVYWASKSPIPGGIAFENFEMKEPFRNGARFIFGVVPLTAELFIDALER
jgi:hypothetical protein